jgi:acetyl esterase
MKKRRISRMALAAAAAASLLLTGHAVAQVSRTPEAAAKIRELGANWNPDVLKASLALYMPMLAKIDNSGVKITRDVAYGPGERHKLDIHQPANPTDGMPILVFVHGGGFTGGEKSSNGLLWDNVTTYFAKRGILGINATYRLAPEHKWPSGAEDVGSVVKWLRANAKDYGGDPNSIFVMGQSAGGTHVGTYIYHEELQPQDGVGIAGAILMSGVYRVLGDKRSEAYYGSDKSKIPGMTALEHVDGRKVPTFLIQAEYDPWALQKETVDLYRALCERDQNCPRYTIVQGHNHLTEAAHINTADESIGPQIIDFIKTHKAGS